MTTQTSAGMCQAKLGQPLATHALSWIRPRAITQKWSNRSGLILMLLAALALLMMPAKPVQAQESCQVSETSLRDAINSYARSCSQPRVDCDPFAGVWICASFKMVGSNPPQTTSSSSNVASSVATSSATVSPDPTPASPARCEFSAPTLNAARIGYDNNCRVTRADCDPSGGQWTCASYQLGATSPGTTGNSGSTPSSFGVSASNSSGTGITYGGDYGPPQRGWLDSYSANGRCYVASGFDHGIGDVRVDTPAGSRTVRQVATALGNGPGIGNNPVYNDVQCGNGPANNAGDEDINQCPGRVDMGTAGCSMRGPKWDLSVFAQQSAPAVQTQAAAVAPTVSAAASNVSSPISGPSNAKSGLPGDSRYKPGDLCMHYDNSGDRDDGHATAASKMVVSYYGLGKALHIVNGTYDARYPNGYNADSEVVLNVTWGSEGRNATWWNADARPDTVRNATATRWRQTLEAGHKVWLAEGGPSDFTAGVLRQLASTTKLNLKNIHVIQHSAWNEDHTSASNISDVKRLASYQPFGFCNPGGNNTPDLNLASDSVARRFLSDPEFGGVWRAAMNYLPVFNCSRSGPHCKFDASDAVALMWILGVQSDEIRDWSDFASRYAN